MNLEFSVITNISADRSTFNMYMHILIPEILNIK